MTSPVLSCRGVAHAYDGPPVLQGVDLDVAPGEFVSVVGSSGCGKSTLLSIVAGLDTATTGTVGSGLMITRSPLSSVA